MGIREDRFTLPFRRTITIAASRISPASSSAQTEELESQKFPQRNRRARRKQHAVAHDRDLRQPGAQAAGGRGQASKGFGKIEVPGTRGAAIGTVAVPGNEGVGEHVRTRFQQGFGPGEIAEQRFRTERRNLVSSAGPVLEKRTLPKVDPAV